jgi:glycosyltransferase involved in cell wall biosynthesis
MEGMPAIVIEAGMMGLPTVAYAIVGVPEIVLDGVTGYLVPEGDRGALADRALQLLADVGARRSMADKARSRAMAIFDITVIAPEYLRIYEELVHS